MGVKRILRQEESFLFKETRQRFLTEYGEKFDEFVKAKLLIPVTYSLDPEYYEILQIVSFGSHEEIITEDLLSLTEIFLRAYTKDSSTWIYRRHLLMALRECPDMFIKSEFEFMNDLLSDNPKVFQIYNHRKWLTELAIKSEKYKMRKEFDSWNYFMLGQAKNYMMWNYLFWLATKTEKWQWILDKSLMLLNMDHFNNSAYHAHFTALMNLNIDDQMKEVELKLIERLGNISPKTNESILSYIGAIISSNILGNKERILKVKNLVLNKESKFDLRDVKENLSN